MPTILQKMRIVSWNVNGLRAAIRNGFLESIKKIQPDILCLQEVRADMAVIPEIRNAEFAKIFNAGEKRGYSGTAIFSKITPVSTSTSTEMDALLSPSEGRVILAEYDNFYIVNVYTPNSGTELARLPFRHDVWDREMLRFIAQLRNEKPVILCGDMNVAHEDIDLSHPEANHFSAGFTDEEREGMSNYVSKYMTDSFRKFFPDKKYAYSWWSYRMRSRERNIGWRIDYVLVDKSIECKITSAFICTNVLGSDHAPVGIDIDI